MMQVARARTLQPQLLRQRCTQWSSVYTFGIFYKPYALHTHLRLWAVHPTRCALNPIKSIVDAARADLGDQIIKGCASPSLSVTHGLVGI